MPREYMLALLSITNVGVVMNRPKRETFFIKLATTFCMPIGTLRAMLPLLLDNIDHAYAMAHHFNYTTCVVAEHQDDTWSCLRWGDDVFLSSPHGGS